MYQVSNPFQKRLQIWPGHDLVYEPVLVIRDLFSSKPSIWKSLWRDICFSAIFDN